MAGGRRRLLDRAWLRGLLAWLLSLYIRFLRLTTRWEWEAPEETRRLLLEKGAFVGCFSHSRIAMTYPAWPVPVERLTVLTSSHRDGLLVARTVEHLGARTVSGSGTAPGQGGAEALKALSGVAAAGEVIGITPDGPRGPFLRVKGGAVMVAQAAGIPLVPFALAQRRASYLKTWDRFVLPWPFSRGLLLFGAPVTVPAERRLGALEETRRQVEAALIALTQEADRRCGHPVLEPGGESALMHIHTKQEEFVYILEGNPTLVTNDGETELSPGMCVGFPPNGQAHHIVNRTDRKVVMLEVGDRPQGDEGSYPHDDIQAVMQDGKWVFTHKDGTPY